MHGGLVILVICKPDCSAYPDLLLDTVACSCTDCMSPGRAVV